MESFSSFADGLRKKIMKTFDEKEVIALILKKFTKQDIKKDLISIRDTVLTVKVSGALKQEIYAKSKEIQRLLKGAGISVTEIR
ncbi:MAG: hypothetical protein KBC67_01925 [Candidatus Pacebacteria bacterium]|nr:hypothetical protein [Candidatus Paceibacterota bacterium]